MFDLLSYRMNGDFKWSKTNRNHIMKPEKEKSYDILIIEQNSDLSDYDTSVSIMSKNANRGFNRSQKVGMVLDNRIKRRKDNRYKPFTLRDYSNENTEENFYAKSGGLGPNIGGKKWQEEKLKRERIKDFTNRLGSIKKGQLIMKRDL